MTNVALQLAESVRSIGVKSVYGEPVEVDGVTVMPVALVQYGFGGGSADEGADAGSGGGGGGLSIPIGAYVKRDGALRFEPNVISLLAVGIPFVCVAGHALARVIHALKR
ncbi:hypothetical protein [Luethyella okanaganae]|uniref:Sporulation protein YtfJ n=1 Tax=Luethyella okanaganae TaxID=69372 RepID=A0ABW1VBG4_9MICO